MVNWSNFDANLGGLLDGSWFLDNPRSGVPVPTLYLPVFEGWPVSFRDYYDAGEGVPMVTSEGRKDKEKQRENMLKHYGLAPPIERCLSDEYRRAWRTTGVALDRVGFAVEDRDRTQGVYYVRYDDPSKGEKKKGFMSKLAFWSKDDIDTVSQYQVKLTSEGKQTRVEVLDKAGRRDQSPTAQRILTLLGEQLR